MNYFDNINGVAHIVAESSRLRATTGGAHMADLVMDKDRDNGTIVSRSTTLTGVSVQAFKAKAAAAGEPLYLLLTPPLAYNTAMKYYSDEKYFYNAQGEVARAYELCVEDIFTVSADAITAASTAPVVGQFVKWDETTGKYIESASAPTGAALCICQIIEKVQYKNSVSYRLQVLKLSQSAT